MSGYRWVVDASGLDLCPSSKELLARQLRDFGADVLAGRADPTRATALQHVAVAALAVYTRIDGTKEGLDFAKEAHRVLGRHLEAT